MTTYCLFFVLYICGISKYTFFWSGSSKNAIFFKFDHFLHSICSSNGGHEHEKGGHMNPMVLYYTIDLWHIKIYIFWSGSSKNAIFLKFNHFSQYIWSSNGGHEHEKGGHINPMVLYCTIDLWHIKTYIFLVRKLKKGNIFETYYST